MATATETRKVTIVRSTEKAHLVALEGIQFWIQARWLKSDSTISAKIADEKIAEVKKAESRKTGGIRFTTVRETEKGIAAKVTCMFPTGDETSMVLWFPKSMARVEDGSFVVPVWLAEKKIDELESESNFRFRVFDRQFNEVVAL